MLLLDDEIEISIPVGLDEIEFTARLGPNEIEAIDTSLTQCAKPHFLKVARLVFDAINASGYDLSDDIVFVHVRRLMLLVEAGVLHSQGNLRRPRFSEVRLS